MLLGDGGGILKNAGDDSIDLVLVHIVPGQDHGAHGDGAGIGSCRSGGLRARGGDVARRGGTAGLAAGAQGQKQTQDEKDRDNLFHMDSSRKMKE